MPTVKTPTSSLELQAIFCSPNRELALELLALKKNLPSPIVATVHRAAEKAGLNDAKDFADAITALETCSQSEKESKHTNLFKLQREIRGRVGLVLDSIARYVSIGNHQIRCEPESMELEDWKSLQDSHYEGAGEL
eukprot:1305812-Prymnesium_polylepis.1